MADPNTTLTGCSGSNYRFGTVPFARYLCILRLDKAVLRHLYKLLDPVQWPLILAYWELPWLSGRFGGKKRTN